MRPTAVSLTASSAFTFPVDSTPPVDWTQSTTKIPLAIATELMDDRNAVGVASNALTLYPGQYLLEFQAVVVNSSTAKNMMVAFTNASGGTVYRSSPNMSIPASSPGTQVSFEALIHLTAVTEVQVRASQTTATAALSIASGNPVLRVTRIGNANEA